MAKIKLTKNELKKQKDNLKRFTRYLPTLELKKKQLLQEINRIRHEMETLTSEKQKIDDNVMNWVGVFAEDIDLKDYTKVKEIIIEEGNIAGIDIPLFSDIVFDEVEYDLLLTPLWIDSGIEVCKTQIKNNAALKVLEQQEEIIRNELRITIQRIKLFEEVKIPDARENIRIIQIFLGDQMTAEVVRGKIAKTKIIKKRREAEPV